MFKIFIYHIVSRQSCAAVVTILQSTTMKEFTVILSSWYPGCSSTLIKTFRST